MIIFRLCLFLIIYWSYLYVLCRKLKVDLFFAPISLTSTITLLMYFAGIFNYLELMTLIIVIVGIILTIYSIIDIIKNPIIIKHIPWIKIAFILFSLFFIIQLFDTHLVHYDNFTHWSVVLKEMLIENKFPGPNNTRIEFFNYPLGSSSFIYFVCKVIGHNENIMLLGQNIFVFSSFFSFFGITKERKRILLYVSMLLGCSILSYLNITIRINTLLVDFLLPILALSSLSIIHYYRKTITKSLILVIPIIGTLTILKQTGIIFATPVIIYIIFILIKYRQYNNKLTYISTLISICISLIPIISWYIYQDIYFSNIINKFEVNSNLINNTLTDDQINTIIKLFINTITDITQRPTIGFIFFNILGISIYIMGKFRLQKKYETLRVLLLGDIFVFIYLMGILGLYIYSMPIDEAIRLAGFERYVSSIIIFLGGIVTFSIVLDIERTFTYSLEEKESGKAFYSLRSKRIHNEVVVGCILISYLTLSSEYYGMAHSNKTYENTIPYIFKNNIGDNWSDIPKSKFLLYAPDTDGEVTSYYLTYVGRYYLRSSNVDSICLFYEDNLINLISRYDKIIIVKDDKHQSSLFNKYSNLKGDPGIYDTKELLSLIKLQ